MKTRIYRSAGNVYCMVTSEDRLPDSPTGWSFVREIELGTKQLIGLDPIEAAAAINDIGYFLTKVEVQFGEVEHRKK